MALSLPGRLVRPRLDTADAVAWRADAVAGGVIGGVALALSWPLVRARDLTTGGGDWPAQAYRVRAVLEHGFASWSHDWAGGMPLWEGYQALPHLLTAGLVPLTGAPVERTMVVIVALLLVALRVGVYAAARWLGAPATAALAGALLAAALDTVWQPTANFTELWGLALAPYALAGGYRWAGRPGGYVVAALVGLSVEVHPLLAVVNGIGLAAACVAAPRGRSLAMLGGQMCVAAAGAAVFW